MRLMTSEPSVTSHTSSSDQKAAATTVITLHAWAQSYLQRFMRDTSTAATTPTTTTSNSPTVVAACCDGTSNTTMQPHAESHAADDGSSAAMKHTMPVPDMSHEGRQLRQCDVIADTLGCRLLRVGPAMTHNKHNNATMISKDDDETAAAYRDDAVTSAATQGDALAASDRRVASLQPCASTSLLQQQSTTPPITTHANDKGTLNTTTITTHSVTPRASSSSSSTATMTDEEGKEQQERQVRCITTHLTHLLQSHTAALGLQGSTAVYGQVTLLGNAMLMTVLRHAVLLQATALHSSNTSNEDKVNGKTAPVTATGRKDNSGSSSSSLSRACRTGATETTTSTTLPEVSARAVLAVLLQHNGHDATGTSSCTTTTANTMHSSSEAVVRVVLQLLSQPCCQGQLRRVLWGALAGRHRHLLRRLHECLRAEAGLSLTPAASSPSRIGGTREATMKGSDNDVPVALPHSAVTHEAAVDDFLRARLGLSAAELEADLFHLPDTLFSVTSTASPPTPTRPLARNDDATRDMSGDAVEPKDRRSASSHSHSHTHPNGEELPVPHDRLYVTRHTKVAVRPMDDGAHFVFTTRSAAFVRAMGRPRTDRFVSLAQQPASLTCSAASTTRSLQQQQRNSKPQRDVRRAVTHNAHASSLSSSTPIAATAAALSSSSSSASSAASLVSSPSNRADVAASSVLSARCVDELWRLMAEMTQLRIALAYMLQLEHLLHECKALWQCHVTLDAMKSASAATTVQQEQQDKAATCSSGSRNGDMTQRGRADRSNTAMLDDGTLRVQSMECVLRALALVLAPCASLLRSEPHAMRFLRKYRLRERTTPDDYRSSNATTTTTTMVTGAHDTHYASVHALYKAFVRAVRGSDDEKSNVTYATTTTTTNTSPLQEKSGEGRNAVVDKVGNKMTRHVADTHTAPQPARDNVERSNVSDDAFLRSVLQTVPACGTASQSTRSATSYESHRATSSGAVQALHDTRSASTPAMAVHVPHSALSSSSTTKPPRLPLTATTLRPDNSYLFFSCRMLPRHTQHAMRTAPSVHHANTSCDTTLPGIAAATVDNSMTHAATTTMTTTCVLQCCRSACTVPWPFELLPHSVADTRPLSHTRASLTAAATMPLTQSRVPLCNVRSTLPRWLLTVRTGTAAHMPAVDVTAAHQQQQQQNVRRLWHALSAAQRAELRRCRAVLRRHPCLLSVNDVSVVDQAAVRRVMQSALQLLLRLR